MDVPNAHVLIEHDRRREIRLGGLDKWRPCRCEGPLACDPDGDDGSRRHPGWLHAAEGHASLGTVHELIRLNHPSDVEWDLIVHSCGHYGLARTSTHSEACAPAITGA